MSTQCCRSGSNLKQLSTCFKTRCDRLMTARQTAKQTPYLTEVRPASTQDPTLSVVNRGSVPAPHRIFSGTSRLVQQRCTRKNACAHMDRGHMAIPARPTAIFILIQLDSRPVASLETASEMHLYAYVVADTWVDQLQAVLVVDTEYGRHFPEKRHASQPRWPGKYSGTAGRVENSQVGVFVALLPVVELWPDVAARTVHSVPLPSVVDKGP